MTPPMPESPPKPRRRWLRFSLGSLLLLFMVIAIPLAWRMNSVHRKRKVVAELLAIPGTAVGYDYQNLGSSMPPSKALGSVTLPSSPPGPKWLRTILGDDFFAEITEVTLSNPELDEAVLARVTALPNLKKLDINEGITDSGLAYVANATKLETLLITSQSVTDAGIAHLRGLKRLKMLTVKGPRMTDEGIRQIATRSQLEQLNLESDQITDDGLKEIAKLPNLEHLYVKSIEITDAGVEHLTNLPELKVLWLRQTQIGGSGMASVGKFRSLELLYTDGSRITDHDLDCLHGITNLQALNLSGSLVTLDGVKRFRAATPKCNLMWTPGPVTGKRRR